MRRHTLRSPTSRSRPPPVIAATASIPAAARRPTRCCSRRDRSRCRGAAGAPLPRRFGPRRHAASARTVARRIRRHRGRQLRRGPRRLARRPGSLPRAGQHVDRLGAVLAPHRCRRAQFSRQCATDSLRPTRYAAAKGASPAGLAFSSCHIRTAMEGSPSLHGLLHHLRQLARGVLGGDLGQRQGLDLAGVAGGTELGVAGDTDRLGGGARRLQVFARIELAGFSAKSDGRRRSWPGGCRCRC